MPIQIQWRRPVAGRRTTKIVIYGRAATRNTYSRLFYAYACDRASGCTVEFGMQRGEQPVGEAGMATAVRWKLAGAELRRAISTD